MTNYLELAFLQILRQNGFKIADNANCSINHDCIVIGLTKDNGATFFGSEVTVYLPSTELQREAKINFGTSGSFSPENQASFWRTIHAASILENWELFLEISRQFTKGKN